MHEDRSVPTTEAVLEMARAAGLRVDAERAKKLRDELVAALGSVAALDDAIDATSPGTSGTGDFRAEWAASDRESRRG